MAKLFYIHEVDELMTNKIKDMALDVILADPFEDDEKVLETITALRYYKDFAKLVVDVMREDEADEDRRFAEIRKAVKQTAKKEEPSDGTDS